MLERMSSEMNVYAVDDARLRKSTDLIGLSPSLKCVADCRGSSILWLCEVESLD